MEACPIQVKKQKREHRHPSPSQVAKVEEVSSDAAAVEEWPLAHELTSSSDFYAFLDVSASFDLSFLDCPTCKTPLQSPIYQCCSGHYACSSCNNSNLQRCLKCAKPSGEIRNIGLESIIRTLRIKCEFSSSGCKEILRHWEKKDHEMVCLYAPHMCPDLDCNFCGLLKDFLAHFTVLHRARSFEFLASDCVSFSLGKHDIYILLQLEKKPMFLLHNKQESIGNIVYLTSFCASPMSGNGRWSYELNVYKGKTKLTLNSVVHSHEVLMVEAKTADFLVIPKQLFDIRRNVDITIKYFLWL